MLRGPVSVFCRDEHVCLLHRRFVLIVAGMCGGENQFPLPIDAQYVASQSNSKRIFTELFERPANSINRNRPSAAGVPNGRAGRLASPCPRTWTAAGDGIVKIGL